MPTASPEDDAAVTPPADPPPVGYRCHPWASKMIGSVFKVAKAFVLTLLSCLTKVLCFWRKDKR